MAGASSVGGEDTAATSAVGGKQKTKYDVCFICGSQEHNIANCSKRWKGDWERIHVADESHYGGNGFPQHQLRELCNLDLPLRSDEHHDVIF